MATDSARAVPNAKHTHEFVVAAGGVTTTNFASSVYAATGTIAGASPDDAADGGTATTIARGDHRHAAPCAAPGNIAPDDAAAEGNSTSFARANHVHGITCGTPAALTKTATAAESAGTGFARDVHVHATSALPWGVVAYQELTGTSSAFSSAADPGTTTDFALSSVVVDATRLYKVYLHTQFILVNTADWLVNFVVGGTRVGRFHAYNTATALPAMINGVLLWLPSSGTVNLDVRVVDNSGAGGTIQFQAASGTNNRQFWVEDIGPR